MPDTRAAYASLATGTLEVTLDSLLAAVDGHDSYTHGHSLRVSDFGKIGIPDERWDGNGYPAKLAGAEIPIESRIVFAADALDAMTTNRPYGTLFTFEGALTELRRWGGQQFDPEVIEALHDAVGVDLLRPVSRGPEADKVVRSLAL